MEISSERSGGVLVLSPQGRVDGSNSTAFLESIQATIGDDDQGVIIDFSGIGYISSAGLRVILILAKELRQRSVGFGLCSLADPVREIFAISGFDQIIKVSDTQAAARKAIS